MSFINHLIKRAKEAETPCTLDVPSTQVGGLVDHILGCSGLTFGDRELVRETLLAGKFAIHGCMLRVIGKVPA